VIIGQVNLRIEAIISVFVHDIEGQTITETAVIDTGFSGYLTLPLVTIDALQLPLIETRPYSLGNNQSVDFDLYGAILVWDEQERDVLVLASEAHPLIGMSMLKGFRVTIDAVDGGEVRIERRQ
jgi:clan AA aspartic protease